MSQQQEAHDPMQEPPAAPPRRREPAFNLPGVVLSFIGLCVGIHLFRMYVLDFQQDLELIVRFAFIPARYSGEYAIDIYAFIGPLSYSLLHGGIAHLLVNMIWLAAFGSPLANRIGTLRFILFWCATSLGAVAFHYVLHSEDITPLVGASGAISGMMGAAARFAFRIDRSGERSAFTGPILSLPEVIRSRQALTFLAVWFVINFVAGVGFGEEGGSRIAWEAHIGGFLIGFFLLRPFDRRQPPQMARHPLQP